MTASSDWKRIAWARAFSSDMWLTPKNWLSPNSRRSITSPTPLSRAGSRTAAGCGLGPRKRNRRDRLAVPARRPRRRRASTRPAGVGEHHRDHAVGGRRALEPVQAVDRAGPHPLDEVLDLRAVLLAAQVEADRLRQLGRVADVPAPLVAVGDRGGVAEVDLTLLTVGVDPPGGAPDGDPGRHLALRLVGPVDRDPRASCRPRRRGCCETSSSVSREKIEFSTVPPTPIGCAEVPVEQVERVRGVVVEAPPPSSLRLRHVPPFALQHHRPVGLAEDVRDGADRAGVEQPLDLAERADEAVVVADLGDEALRRRASAASSLSVLARSSVNGFSQNTCRPRSSAARTMPDVRARRAWRSAPRRARPRGASPRSRRRWRTPVYFSSTPST